MKIADFGGGNDDRGIANVRGARTPGMKEKAMKAIFLYKK